MRRAPSWYRSIPAHILSRLGYSAFTISRNNGWNSSVASSNTSYRCSFGRDPEVGTPVIGDWQHPVGHLLRKVVFLLRTLANFKVGERRQRLVRTRGKMLAARC